VTERSHAVFLSYASQDAEAAQRICTALRAAGIEVFLDQSELRGGDAWDQKIRREIHDCALFIPIVSRHTQARLEGYFRHEWKLAVERTHHMAEQKPFLVPVVVDGTGDREAIVPDPFRAVQWTRLTAGETGPAFIERVRLLLSPEGPAPAHGFAGAPPGGAAVKRAALRASWSLRAVWVAAAVGLAALAAWLAVGKLGFPGSSTPSPAVATARPDFAPPPRSIAVLPFVNMSGDKEQEYFSDGLTEELLNSLAAVDGLQVAARTSSFSFKGKDADIGTVARRLNVSSVLEGSVRRSAHTLRVTAQLIDAVTGFHLWSKTYDRDLGDVLKLQTQIATAVAEALKITLLADAATRIELGGTRNPAAFDAYLHAERFADAGGGENYLRAAAAYTDAIRLDPTYALAFAGRSFAQSLYAAQSAGRAAVREYFDKALADAHQAITLAPELAEGHVSLGFYLANGALDLRQAVDKFRRARALAPGRATILRVTGLFAVMTGGTEAGLADLRRAVTLDPLNATTHHLLGFGSYLAHRYEDAGAANAQAISLDHELLRGYEFSGLSAYALGKFSEARDICEQRPNYWGTQWCLALAYQKLGRQADAQAAVAKIEAMQGDTTAYQFATIYAQWGDTPKALEWLERAMRLRDPGLGLIRCDPLLDPLRREPRYQAVEAQLKFPE
jgi:TolB-like protein